MWAESEDGDSQIMAGIDDLLQQFFGSHGRRVGEWGTFARAKHRGAI